jgi:hypothetical protein
MEEDELYAGRIKNVYKILVRKLQRGRWKASIQMEG